MISEGDDFNIKLLNELLWRQLEDVLLVLEARRKGLKHGTHGKMKAAAQMELQTQQVRCERVMAVLDETMSRHKKQFTAQAVRVEAAMDDSGGQLPLSILDVMPFQEVWDVAHTMEVARPSLHPVVCRAQPLFAPSPQPSTQPSCGAGTCV